MARRETRLPASQFGKVRRCARSCWIESGCDKDKAIRLVEDRMRTEVGSVFLTIAIQIAIKLIIWWFQNRVSEPSVVSQVGEPGTNDEDLNLDESFDAEELEGEYQ
jgi:hypothetical protein